LNEASLSGNRPPKTSPHVRTHFERRLKERYGIEITRKECKQLESDLPAYLHLFKATHSRSWFLIPIKGQLVYACYQKNLGLTTVLTPKQFWDSNQSLQVISYSPELDPIKIRAEEDKKKRVPYWNEQLVKQKNPPAPFVAEPSPDTQHIAIKMQLSHVEKILGKAEKIGVSQKTEVRGRVYLYTLRESLKPISKNQHKILKEKIGKFYLDIIVGTVEIIDCAPVANGYEWHFANPENMVVHVPVPKGCRITLLTPINADEK
jgi:hypothetical protein